LLPIEQPRVVATEKGFAFTPTAAGKETAFLQLDAERAVSLQHWTELPKTLLGRGRQPKPGATVLAQPVEEGGQAIPKRRRKMAFWSSRSMASAASFTWAWTAPGAGA